MVVDDEINKAYDPHWSCSSDDNEIDDLYNKSYNSPVRAKKDLKSKLAKNQLLHEIIKELENENHDLNILVEKLLTKNKNYYECETYKGKNNELLKAM